MNEFSQRTRRESLALMANRQFDVLIIGGGITGAGLALDAAARGLSVAMVEKRDFASGTSSRSTKLIHGGLRYLEHFDFALVREALSERATLNRIAPRLAISFPFVIPIYKDARRNYDHPLKMRAGLLLYDLLAGQRNLARHQRIDRAEALRLAPQLNPNGLQGAFLYYDALTDDARLVVEIIKSAAERGAQIANYATVTAFIQTTNSGKNPDGSEPTDDLIRGAQVRDELTGDQFSVRASVVINATGVWLEDTLKLDPHSSMTQSKTVRPAKGIHLTIAAERLPVSAAWLIPSLTGHRFYFVVPWQNRVNIGTTDTDYTGDKDAPAANSNEVAEILDAINSYFPAARLEPADIISTWAGLRPLISDPRARDTTAVSRKEEIFASPNGLISVGGGKLTTYRLMAERGIDLAAQRLSKQVAGSTTAQIALYSLTPDESAAAIQHLIASENLTPETARHLIGSYGSNFTRLIELMQADEILREPLVAGLPHIAAEIAYAARHEMAVTLSDVMMRRTRLAILAGAASLACAPTAAQLMAWKLGWSKAEIENQLAQYSDELKREFLTTTIQT